jgi:hypothetical protein
MIFKVEKERKERKTVFSLNPVDLCVSGSRHAGPGTSTAFSYRLAFDDRKFRRDLAVGVGWERRSMLID